MAAASPGCDPSIAMLDATQVLLMTNRIYRSCQGL